MDEKFLYHVWDAGHLRSELRTVSGKPVKILFPGQFNTFRGPDFINAILNLDGHDVQGAIEIHQSTLDWQRHHHQEDHYYNSVVLHVVLNHNGELPQTQKENGEWVDILKCATSYQKKSKNSCVITRTSPAIKHRASATDCPPWITNTCKASYISTASNGLRGK
jgi:hypothetical protein